MANTTKAPDAHLPNPVKKPELSTFEKRLDQFDDAALAAKGAYKAVTGAYASISAQKDLITAASKAMLDAETLDAVTRTATDILGPVQKVMGGLDALSTIHPFVKIAVLAFNAVVTLELKRRENDKRICALLLKKADMMVTLLQLADIRDPDVIGPEGDTIKGRMSTVLEKISKKINECGNAIDAYYKQKFIVKFFKSHGFESKFMGYASSFDDLKGEIQYALQFSIVNKVVSIDSKLDKIDTLLTAVFQQHTAKERELAAKVEARGGKAALLKDEAALNEVLAQTDPAAGPMDSSLLASLHADLDNLLEENMIVFKVTIEAQTQQLEKAIEASESRVIAAIQAGPHELVEDPDIRVVWKAMSWRSSVKARHFVLAMHDYYIEKLTIPAVTGTQQGTGIDTNASATLKGINGPKSDAWCLRYLDVLYAPAILEVVDEDSSSFIKIKEVNDFASSRPTGWSLPQWIAYWAYGWAVETNLYQLKINFILADMLDASLTVLPENRTTCVEYLDSAALSFARTLIESTKFARTDDLDLLALVRHRMETIEADLTRELVRRQFNLEVSTDAALVGGTGRIERFIFPLLYLLLKHHYGVIKLASQVALDEQELRDAAESINNAVIAVRDRMEKLQDAYRQQRINAAVAFKHFANAIFLTTRMKSPPDLSNIRPMARHEYWTDEPHLPLVNATVDEQYRVDSLRHPPITIPIGEGMQELYDNYCKTGLAAFTDTNRRYVDLLRSQRLRDLEGGVNVLLEPLFPFLTTDEDEWMAETETTLGDAELSFYQAVADLECRKEVIHSKSCYNCKRSTLAGTRFDCVECPYFTLCGTCEASTGEQRNYDTEKHPDSHNMIRITEQTALYNVLSLKRSAEGILNGMGDSQDPPDWADPAEVARIRFGQPLGSEEKSDGDEDDSEDTALSSLPARVKALEKKLEKLEKLEKLLELIADTVGVDPIDIPN